MIYLDNAASTAAYDEVVQSALPYFSEQYGNPSTRYALGRTAREAVDKARRSVADFIGARPEQIVFTSGGTEANNMALRYASLSMLRADKSHVVVSSVEHDSVRKFADRLKEGFEVTFVDPKQNGVITTSSVFDAITEDTGVVSVMCVNNETGAENDIEEIGRICHEKGILFHTDCVQAAGQRPLDVTKIGCDFLTLSAHKIHGFKGAGALFIRDACLAPETPLIVGGSQESGFRAGTENVPAIVAFGKACDITRERLHDIDVHTSAFKQTFFVELKRSLAIYDLEDIVHINGDLVIKHGRILNLRFDGVDAETLLLLLDVRGVYVSAGAACHENKQEPSRVLTAMGLSPEEARSSIRISFSDMNTAEEIVEAAKIVAESVQFLHKVGQ